MAETIDLADSIYCLRYYAGLADKVSGKTIETNDAEKFAYTRVEPIGVTGAIIPWNYPIQMAAWKLGPALAAGNALILKPAEQTPLSILRLAELAVEAGYPAGALSVINGLGKDVGAAISNHPLIRKVAFTGSTITGRRIMTSAAQSNLKKVTLELGGKSPVLVFDDVNIDEAVPWVALAILFNQGQDCCAGSRLFVQRGIHDKFVAKLAEAFKAHKTGDPFDDATSHGPQVSKEQYEKILSYIQYGKDDGAKVVCGGGREDAVAKGSLEGGYWVAPTIFTGCKPGMRIVEEEIFGPVLAVIPFDTEEEAIEKANDTEYGLGAGIFSENGTRCVRVAAAIKAGTGECSYYSRRDVNFEHTLTLLSVPPFVTQCGSTTMLFCRTRFHSADSSKVVSAVNWVSMLSKSGLRSSRCIGTSAPSSSGPCVADVLFPRSYHVSRCEIPSLYVCGSTNFCLPFLPKPRSDVHVIVPTAIAFIVTSADRKWQKAFASYWIAYKDRVQVRGVKSRCRYIGTDVKDTVIQDSSEALQAQLKEPRSLPELTVSTMV